MTLFHKKFLNDLLDLTCKIQQIPSPTQAEEKKARFLAEQFQLAGLKDIHLDAAGNALGRIPGGRRPPIIISAHIDTVHPLTQLLEINRRPDRIIGPSIGDNSLGVASLLAVAWWLTEHQRVPAGDIWLVGNVGEEGLGNLRGMRQLVESFGRQPVAYLVLEGMGLGQIYHRGLGVDRYRITASTAGGHSWVDYGKPSAIHEIAALITHLVAIPLSRQPRTSLNVGIIQGGTSINTVASRASLELDLRSEDQANLQNVIKKITQMVEDAAKPDVQFEMVRIGLRPAGSLPADHPLVQLAENALREEGVFPHLEIASTDANIPLSLGIPAVCIGITFGAKAHTLSEFFEVEPIHQGLGQLFRIVEGIWTRLD